MQRLIDKVLLIVLFFSMATPVFSSGASKIVKLNALSYKSDWLKDYYDNYKTMRTEIIIFQMDNPKDTSHDVAKKLSKTTPEAKVIKEIKLSVSGESIIATILLKEPDGGVFKEDVLTGRCLGTNVNVLEQYCR